MGLIASSALGLFAWQWEQQVFDSVPDWPFEADNWLNIMGGQILVLAWFVAGRGLTRLRAERRQPGFLTAVCLVLGSLWISLMNWQVVRRNNPPLASLDLGHWIAVYVFASPIAGGMIVAAAAVSCCWASLWLAGAWAPARGTLDRLGLVLGGSTLALTLGWYAWIFFGPE